MRLHSPERPRATPRQEHDPEAGELNVLSISGERKAEHQDEQQGFYRVERSFGHFARTLTLPKGVDAEGVTAAFDRGVLEVRIPKPAAAKPRRIEITPNAGEQPAIEGSESA